MTPVKPVSVKFNNEEERARLKALAATLGWTESQVIRDSVAYALHCIRHPESKEEPKLITHARLLINLQTGSDRLKKSCY